MRDILAKKGSVIDNALSAWKHSIGQSNVLSDSQTLSLYKSSTYESKNSIIAVLTPKNSKEVQSCIRIANDYKIPLYPISKGKNWGYGSRTPAKDGCAILSLEKNEFYK